ncbi:MAG TPA: heme-binding protein [Caulobacteraceae bacterium]|nr:heme-binding protein [Caulobacteraceae bacterium]
MNSRWIAFLAGTGAALAAGTVALAAGSGFPGDNGKPGLDGIMPPPAPPRPPGSAPPAPRPVAPAPPIAVALRAAQAIAAGCKQFPLGVVVVNSAAQPILVYIPDGSRADHTYMALRKAYSAVTFGVNTSAMVKKAQTDPAVQAQIHADPNLIAYSGGILLKSGDKIVGAIGVSGSEPGAHDEECGMIGVAAIKDDLK